MIPTRGRGGGHDWIGVDALLWVDHVEIRLLLSRIKAVWAAMRQVRGVVVIVMVHEVKEVSKTVPCDEFIRRKPQAGKRKEGEEGEEEGKRTQARVGRERKEKFDSTSQTGVHLFIFILFLTAWGEGDDPSSVSLPAPIDIDRCDSTDRNPSSPITKCPNERCRQTRRGNRTPTCNSNSYGRHDNHVADDISLQHAPVPPVLFSK
jgi:hypothetical protein